MDLRQYLRLLRVRRLLIVVCALLGLGVAAAATLTTTPVYEASTVLFVSTGDSSNVGSAYTGNLFTQQRVKSYAEIIKSPEVLDKVVDELSLPVSSAALAGKVTADAPLDTVLLNVSVRDTDPARARDIANATSKQFSTVVSDLERGDADRSSLVKASVVTPATLPGGPVSPRPKVNLALGLLAGLAIGIGAAVARETLDTTVKGAEDLQERTELSTLAIIPFDPQAAANPLMSRAISGTQRAESFRQLRTNLQFVDVDQRPTSLVVTSSVPGEGKSTTAANLAITMAEGGADVILVEGDLRRPRVAEYLGVEQAVGLTDVLIGRVELEDALQPWGTSGHMWVLPSGPRPPNPSEVLGSENMRGLVKQLEGRGFVIIDAPPLLPVTDAAVLSTQTSGTLVVVRMGKTRREQVQRALESLAKVSAHVYGGILSMAPQRGPDAYQYGYGYGYDGADRPEPKSRWRAASPPAPNVPVDAARVASTADQPTA